MSDITVRMLPTLRQAAATAGMTRSGLAVALRRIGRGLIVHDGKRFVDETILMEICAARAALGFKVRGRKAKKENLRHARTPKAPPG